MPWLQMGCVVRQNTVRDAHLSGGSHKRIQGSQLLHGLQECWAGLCLVFQELRNSAGSIPDGQRRSFGQLTERHACFHSFSGVDPVKIPVVESPLRDEVQNTPQNARLGPRNYLLVQGQGLEGDAPGALDELFHALLLSEVVFAEEVVHSVCDFFFRDGRFPPHREALYSSQWGPLAHLYHPRAVAQEALQGVYGLPIPLPFLLQVHHPDQFGVRIERYRDEDRVFRAPREKEPLLHCRDHPTPPHVARFAYIAQTRLHI